MMNRIGGGGGTAGLSNALFAKLDTKKQGYIEQSDLAAALAKTEGGSDSAEQLFAKLDGDQDGKVTKSELSEAVARIAQQLDAEFDQARVGRGGRPPQGPPPPPPNSGDDGATDSASAAADLNGDGTVTSAEEAVYAAMQAERSNESASGERVSGASFERRAPPSFTKEQLTEQLASVDASDTRRTAALTKLIENFDTADANGDGSLSGREGRTYLRSEREAAMLNKVLESLKSYFENETDTSTVNITA